MASSKGHDSDKAPDAMQELWIAALAAGESPTQAARTAGYRHPRSAAYDNLRSNLLHRVNQERFEAARAVLRQNQPVDVSTHPLGPHVSLLRGLDAVKPLVVPYQEEYHDQRTGRVKTRRRRMVVQQPDNLRQIQSAETVLALQGFYPLAWNRRQP